MIKEAIDRILDLAKPSQFKFEELNGALFSDRRMFPIEPHNTPLQAMINVKTLSGVTDFLLSDEGKECRENGCTVHVKNYDDVVVFSGVSEYHRCRHFYVGAVFQADMFPFGRYLSQEDFIIQASSKFVLTSALSDVLKIVSSVRTCDKATCSDDGISQTVTVTNQMKRLEETKAKPFHELEPFRTFREVKQPRSRFLLRSKQDGDRMPMFALYEADNSQWKLDAMRYIQSFIEGILFGGSDDIDTSKIRVIM